MSQVFNERMRRRYIELGLNVPTQFDNQAQFQKPDNSEWVRFSIRPAVSTQVDITSNNPRTRTTGVILIQIFSPLGKGDKAAMQLADAIKAQFRMVTAEGVTYQEPTITTVGEREGWWQVNVTCPFQYDEIVTTGA